MKAKLRIGSRLTARIAVSNIVSSIVTSIIFIGSIVAAGSASAYSGNGKDYFRSLRDDQTIPSHCKEVQLDHFKPAQLEFFTFGSMGAEKKGFTYEYPLRREDARKLWSMMKEIVAGEDVDLPKDIRNQSDLARDFEILKNNYREMDFDFGSEGEILELLAIVDIYRRISTEYYVYGSIFYADQKAGELDLVIAKKSNCEVQAVGEAKLGLNGLGKAHRQLARFKQFIEVHAKELLESLDLRRQL